MSSTRGEVNRDERLEPLKTLVLGGQVQS